MESSKAVVKFAVTLANSVDKVLADNKVDLMDIPHVMAPLMQVGAFAGALKTAKDEFKAATPEQKAELIAQVKTELDLKSDRTEEIVEKSLDLAVAVADIVKLIKA
jgi:hypothetical protein